MTTCRSASKSGVFLEHLAQAALPTKSRGWKLARTTIKTLASCQGPRLSPRAALANRHGLVVCVTDTAKRTRQLIMDTSHVCVWCVYPMQRYPALEPEPLRSTLLLPSQFAHYMSRHARSERCHNATQGGAWIKQLTGLQITGTDMQLSILDAACAQPMACPRCKEHTTRVVSRVTRALLVDSPFSKVLVSGGWGSAHLALPATLFHDALSRVTTCVIGMLKANRCFR